MEIWIDGAVRAPIYFKRLAKQRIVANAMVRATTTEIVPKTRNKRATMQAQVNKLLLNQEVANKLQANKLNQLNEEVANKLNQEIANKLNQEIANKLQVNKLTKLVVNQVGNKEGAT